MSALQDLCDATIGALLEDAEDPGAMLDMVVESLRRSAQALKLPGPVLFTTFDGQVLRDGEFGTIYLEDDDRFVVTLMSSYGKPDDEIETPADAAAALLGLATDSGADGTHWFVYDRATGVMHQLELGDRAWEVAHAWQ